MDGRCSVQCSGLNGLQDCVPIELWGAAASGKLEIARARLRAGSRNKKPTSIDFGTDVCNVGFLKASIYSKSAQTGLSRGLSNFEFS
jgi:hypothetical protein